MINTGLTGLNRTIGSEELVTVKLPERVEYKLGIVNYGNTSNTINMIDLFAALIRGRSFSIELLYSIKDTDLESLQYLIDNRDYIYSIKCTDSKLLLRRTFKKEICRLLINNNVPDVPIYRLPEYNLNRLHNIVFTDSYHINQQIVSYMYMYKIHKGINPFIEGVTCDEVTLDSISLFDLKAMFDECSDIEGTINPNPDKLTELNENFEVLLHRDMIKAHHESLSRNRLISLSNRPGTISSFFTIKEEKYKWKFLIEDRNISGAPNIRIKIFDYSCDIFLGNDGLYIHNPDGRVTRLRNLYKYLVANTKDNKNIGITKMKLSFIYLIDEYIKYHYLNK